MPNFLNQFSFLGFVLLFIHFIGSQLARFSSLQLKKRAYFQRANKWVSYFKSHHAVPFLVAIGIIALEGLQWLPRSAHRRGRPSRQRNRLRSYAPSFASRSLNCPDISPTRPTMRSDFVSRVRGMRVSDILSTLTHLLMLA
jgi:hypothetical protein